MGEVALRSRFKVIWANPTAEEGAASDEEQPWRNHKATPTQVSIDSATHVNG